MVKDEPIFRGLPPREVVNVMYKMTVRTGQTIFNQGDIGDSYFIVTKGRFDILVKEPPPQASDAKAAEDGPGDPAAPPTTNPTAEKADPPAGGDKDSKSNSKSGPPRVKRLFEASKGTAFGENALMASTRRGATVQASKQSVVWVLESQPYRELLRKHRSPSSEMARAVAKLKGFLSQVPIFKKLSPKNLEHVAGCVREVSFKNRTTVIRQGDLSSFFYIIKEGTAIVLKAPSAGGDPVQVNSYSRGDFFGERGLILHQPRAATVVATCDLLCLVMDESDFSVIEKPLAKNFEEVIGAYKDVDPPTPPEFTNRIDTKLSEFKNLGVLGVGSFGRVSLVKDPNDKHTYSLKSVRKNRVVETGQQEHMKNERAVMAILDCPFIVKLIATYKDRTRVYFLMEAVLGGELFTVLRYNRKFSERTSRFYAGCCVLAFEHMHQKNVIYRDLKPENLLLDERGFIKITDFGFAKKRNNTCTLCGTPEYLAPEVIRNWTQSFAVDWWGLGILIYEMVVSHPPFEDDEHMKMYEKILTAPVVYPRHVSRTARDLVDSLLRKNSYQRLGAGLGGAAAVKRHPWFKGFDWDSLASRTLKSPYVPRIRDREDLSCFEYYPDDEHADEELCADEDSPVFAWTSVFDAASHSSAVLSAAAAGPHSNPKGGKSSSNKPSKSSSSRKQKRAET